MKHRLITLIAAAALVTACMPERSITVWPAGGGGGETSAILVSPSAPAAGMLVTFDSSPLGAGIRTWAFGDGGLDTGMIVAHTFAAEGTYDVVLSLIDGAGAPAEHLVRLVVSDGGADPEVRALPRRRRG